MKKFKSTLPDGGLKFFNKYLESELGNEIWDAIHALIEDFKDETEGFILQGGTVTGSSPNAQINDSIVILDGKICRIAAQTGLTYPFYIERSTRNVTGDYADLVSRDTVFENYAIITASAPASGQYVTIAAAGEYRRGGLAKRMIEDNGTILKTKVIEIGNWDMVATSSVTIAHDIADADKIRGLWVNIRKDSGIAVLSKNLNTQLAVGTAGNDGQYTWDDTNITLSRKLSGAFDSVDYDEIAGYNRGWITIQYEE
jgi:hypothetical protein